MDWANERYVRLYVRDTDDLLVLSWEARALLWELMRKADRAGVIETRRGARGIAAITRIPAEVVQTALPQLLEGDGAPLIEHPRGYLLRNFLEAQEARSSDALRARESRGKRREIALAPDVTKRDACVTKRDTDGSISTPDCQSDCSSESFEEGVTKRDATVTQRDASITIRDANVTRGHTASHAVTTCHSSLLSLPTLPSLARGSENQAVTKRDARDPGASPQTPPAKVSERAGKGGKKPIPADWLPNETGIALARELGLDIARETHAFRDHALQNDRKLADWQAGFRSWLRKSAAWRQRHRGNGQFPPEFKPL